MKIVYCKSKKEYDKFKAYNDRSNLFFLTSSYELLHFLKSKNIKLINELNYLNQKVVSENIVRSFEITQNWIKNKISISDLKFDLAEFTSCDTYWFFQSCINSFHVYSKILENYDIDEVMFCDSIITPIFTTGPQPIHENIYEINKAVFKY